MSIKSNIRQARALLASLSAADLGRVRNACRDIQTAQNELLAAADTMMVRCRDGCQGLCCRNVDLDAIISPWDLVYILILKPELQTRIASCTEDSEGFYSSDCPFLEAGVGPCIFPTDVRPEVCITSFCTSTTPINGELRRVKRAFFKLYWIGRWGQLHGFLKALWRR